MGCAAWLLCLQHLQRWPVSVRRGDLPALQSGLHRARWLDQHHGAGEPYLPLLEALGRLGRGPEGHQLVAVLRQQAPS